MPKLMSHSDHVSPALVEAVDWVVLLLSGNATRDDLHALDTWRDARPENDEAFRTLSAVRPMVRAIKTERRVTRRKMMGAATATTAAIAMIGIARPPLGLWPSFAELMADHRTGPGQRLAFSPSVGVDIELNSSSSMSLLAGDKGLRLIDGEAFVSVDRAKPFHLETDGARFVTTAARFNVETLAGGVRMTCLAGHMLCSNGTSSTRIQTGQEWRLSASGSTGIKSVNPSIASSWRQGILHFRDTPLAEVVEQFNRYRSVPIVLASTTTGTRRVSGIFHTDDINAAVAQLQQLLGLRVRTLPGDVVLVG